MAEPTNPEYDRFADEARREIAQQQAQAAAYQRLALQLLAGERNDVRVGEPDE